LTILGSYSVPHRRFNVQEAADGICKKNVIANLALPYYQNSPTGGTEVIDLFVAPFDIPSQLGEPVLRSRFWNAGTSAGVLVPETPVDKDHRLPAWENKIWFAGQSRVVQPKSVAEPMGHLTHHQLRLSVFPQDERHVRAS
jgi:hypothetical protein